MQNVTILCVEFTRCVVPYYRLLHILLSFATNFIGPVNTKYIKYLKLKLKCTPTHTHTQIYIYRIYSRNLRTFFLVWPLKNRGA
jgi:hypothetical protein